MQGSYALNAYRSHDLSIEMRTSSGDVINLGMSNSQSLSLEASKDGNSSTASFSFSSMQSFSFSVASNGIDDQDRKEIAAFMEVARPYIERYMKELEGGEGDTPRNKVAQNIAESFAPAKGRGEAVENLAKQSIVSLFDDAAKRVDAFEKILDEAQKLLEKSLELFDRGNEARYA
jgi:hypothetical protein